MDTIHHLRIALARVAGGEPTAREELFARVERRLRQLLSRSLHRDFARLRSVEQTDDLLQDLHLRLLKSWDRLLHDEQGQAIHEPATFLSRVSRLIREVLLDAVRHHFGRSHPRSPMKTLDTHDPSTSGSGHDPASDSQNPEALAQLSEFHQAVEQLPEPLKAVVDLRWYQQLTYPEVAELLGLGESTVRKYWVQARLKLIDQLGDNPFAE